MIHHHRIPVSMTANFDWNDESVPVGKRKVAFVKWLTKERKVSLIQAKAMANSKFGPSQASLQSERIRQEHKERHRDQSAIRRFGHVAQYEEPVRITGNHDIAGLLKRLSLPSA
jgi:hypothetical protein